MKKEELILLLSKCRLALEDEKKTQADLAQFLTNRNIPFLKEFHLDKVNIIDFYFEELKLGVEIKISKISRRSIEKQIERYCQFEKIESIICLTNRIISLPKIINGKPATTINLGKAWM